MTRIGYLASQYPASSHTFIAREIAGLRALGADIRTFSIRPGEPGAELPDGEGPPCRAVLGLRGGRLLAIVLHEFAAHPLRALSTLSLALKHRVPGLRSVVWALFHFAEALVLVRLLREAGVDRVHNHFANSGATVGMLACHFLELPWSLTLHGISETDYPAGQLLSAKIERSEFVACASWFMAAQGARLVDPRHWHKFTLVRCEISPQALPPALPVQPAGARELRLIAVGRLSRKRARCASSKHLPWVAPGWARSRRPPF